VWKTWEEAEIHDPFADLLELAESVRKRLNWFRLVTLFGFISGFLFGIILLIITVPRAYAGEMNAFQIGFVVFLSAVSLIVAFVSLRLANFLLFFEKRIDTLSKARVFNATPRIPEGATPLERIMAYLRQTDREIADASIRHPQSFNKKKFEISGLSFDFDSYLYLRRFRGPWLGVLQVFIRVAQGELTIKELQRFKMEVETVVKKRHQPARRVILVQAQGKEIPDEITAWIEENWTLYPVKSKRGKEIQACPIELFRETAEGIYELAIFYVG